MAKRSMLIPRDDNGASYPAVKLGAVQTVAAGASSAAIANPLETEVIRVACSVDCHIAQGAAPVATTNDSPLFAGTIEYLRNAPGEKIAVIKAAGEADGTLYVTEGR